MTALVLSCITVSDEVWQPYVQRLHVVIACSKLTRHVVNLQAVSAASSPTGVSMPATPAWPLSPMLPAAAHDSSPMAADSPQHQQPLAQQPKSASTCLSPISSQISEQHQRLFTELPIPVSSRHSPSTLTDHCQPQSEQAESSGPHSSPFTATHASEYAEQPHTEQMGSFGTSSTSPPATHISECRHQPHAGRFTSNSAPASDVAAVDSATLQQAFFEQAEVASTAGSASGVADATASHQSSDSEQVRPPREH